MTERLSGKVALVTGAGSGIGRATVRLFVAEGATVYAAGRTGAKLAETCAGIEGAFPIEADVTKPADLARLFEAITTRHGRLDVLFANAGLGAKAYLGAIEPDHIDALFDVNVKGLIRTVQGALPLLGSGASIILNAGIIASKGYAGWSVYSATKAAVRSLARTWSSDLRGKGIRVNVVSPGVVLTPGYEAMLPDDAQRAAFFDLTAGLSPLERNGAPEEVARAVLFLASDESSFVAGAEIFADGGAAQI